MDDFNITLSEACEILNRSKKSISRYISKGLLHPIKIKNQNGILEYRFSKSDIEAFKLQETSNAVNKIQNITSYDNNLINKSYIDSRINNSGQQWTVEDIVDTGGQDSSGHEKTLDDKKEENTEIIILLKETIGLLKEQLSKKDEQIKDLGFKIDQLIERNRETNILIGHLQNKVLMLEKQKDNIDKESQKTQVDTIRHDKTQMDTKNEITQTTINPNTYNNNINNNGQQWTGEDIVDTGGQDSSGQDSSGHEKTKNDTKKENQQDNSKKSFFTIIRNFLKLSK